MSLKQNAMNKVREELSKCTIQPIAVGRESLLEEIDGLMVMLERPPLGNSDKDKAISAESILSIACNIKEARDLIEQLDKNKMPEIDGAEALRQMRLRLKIMRLMYE